MGVRDDHGVDRARLEALEAELVETRRQLDELGARVRRDTARTPAPIARRAAVHGPDGGQDGGPDDGPRPVSRRRLIAGAAGAVAAGAAVVVGNASPAAANSQGQSLTLGEFTNSATSTTGLHATSVDPVLLIGSYGTTTGNAAQFYVHDAGNTSAVTHHETAGNGPAAEFIASNESNTASTVSVQTDGIGSAGSFVASNAANNAAALGVLGKGTGPALSAAARGGGNAAFFSSNGTSAALFVAMTGTGGAAIITDTTTTGTNPGLFVQTTAHAAAIRAKSPTTNINLWPRTGGAPTADTVQHGAGDLVEDSAGNLWACVTGGTPGAWRKLAGPAAAGSLHLLATPVRVYDSRPGTTPAIGLKTRLAPGTARTVDFTANSSGVPAGALGAMVNLLIVNAPAADANFTLWKNGAARPSSNTMVWGGDAGRFSTLAVTALDASGKAQVLSSVTTDVVIDVVGYYR